MYSIKELEKELGYKIIQATDGKISLEELYNFGKDLGHKILELYPTIYDDSNSPLVDALDEIDLLHDDFTRDYYRRHPDELRKYGSRLLGEEVLEREETIYSPQKS